MVPTPRWTPTARPRLRLPVPALGLILALAIAGCTSADEDAGLVMMIEGEETGDGATTSGPDTAATAAETTDGDGAAAGIPTTAPGAPGATALAPPDGDGGPPPAAAPDAGQTADSGPASSQQTAPGVDPGTVRPDWLGTRVLPMGADGRVPPQSTPPELINRRLPTVDILPRPTDDEFVATAQAVPADVLARSTWNEGCPVTVEDLRYLQLSFWGFDGAHHQGEMIVHRDVVDDVTSVFRTLHAARFPIEEMRVTAAAELDALPTGDGNNTTAFVCRSVVGSSVFSQHAYGLAVDINPFQNPYRKGEVVLPELSTAYLDRNDVRPGMILDGGVVTEAFDRIGWGWGGRWNSLDDYHHFSRNNR